jgi:hypothetical protein
VSGRDSISRCHRCRWVRAASSVSCRQDPGKARGERIFWKPSASKMRRRPQGFRPIGPACSANKAGRWS